MIEFIPLSEVRDCQLSGLRPEVGALTHWPLASKTNIGAWPWSGRQLSGLDSVLRAVIWLTQVISKSARINTASPLLQARDPGSILLLRRLQLWPNNHLAWRLKIIAVRFIKTLVMLLVSPF